jgi:hypothetical protein
LEIEVAVLSAAVFAVTRDDRTGPSKSEAVQPPTACRYRLLIVNLVTPPLFVARTSPR